MNTLYIWIAIAVITAIIEMLTVSIVSCWFTIGAIGAMAAYFIGATPLIQFVVFIICTALSLIFARPLIKKHNKTAITPTNADMLIGQQGVVVQTIDNIKSEGAVKIKGLEWSAKSQNNQIISAGETITVEKIEGVKLIVSLTENK